MKNKLFLYGFMLLQAFNVFSSVSEVKTRPASPIKTEPSVAMFKVESSQDYQSLKKPENMKIFVGEEFLGSTSAQHEDVQKVLNFIEKNKIVASKDVKSVVVLLGKNSMVIVYHYHFGNTLFEEYTCQFEN